MTCVEFELKSLATNAKVVTTSPSAILWGKRKEFKTMIDCDETTHFVR